jgi:hypothetical protein
VATKTELRAAIRARVEAAWPEVITNGIFYPDQAASFSFEAVADAEALPYAVIDITQVETSDEWGMGNRVDAGPAFVFYVAQDDFNPETMEAKLDTLRAALYTSGLSEGQVIGWPDIDAEPEDVPAHLYFRASVRPFRVGVCEFQVIVGEMG